MELHELMPGGKDIPVTHENKLKYIALMANYKVKKLPCLTLEVERANQRPVCRVPAWVFSAHLSRVTAFVQPG